MIFTDFNLIQIGQTSNLKVEITSELVQQFVNLTGDNNPLHVSDEFALQTVFNRRVVHGMLPASFLSTIIGTKLPGPGSLWISQTFEFKGPVRVGEVLNINVTVDSKSPSENVVVLSVVCRNEQQQVKFKGVGKVKVLKKSQADDPSNSWKDYCCLVTGGARGVGAAIALRLGELGCKTVINCKNRSNEAQLIADQIRQAGGSALVAIGDISKEENCNRILQQVQHEFGSINVLINNAVAPFDRSLIHDTALTSLTSQIDTSLLGPFHLIKGVLPAMKEQRFGRIISILTTATIGAPPEKMGSYLIGKMALEALARTVAVEYGPFGITSNLISPSIMRTELSQHVSERIFKIAEAQTPVRRLCRPSDIVGAVEYLCDPRNSFVNGEKLVLAGGASQ